MIQEAWSSKLKLRSDGNEFNMLSSWKVLDCVRRKIMSRVCARDEKVVRDCEEFEMNPKSCQRCWACSDCVRLGEADNK